DTKAERKPLILLDTKAERKPLILLDTKAERKPLILPKKPDLSPIFTQHFIILLYGPHTGSAHYLVV
ncbi:MAG: hypothetical protein VCB59_10595, partial [Gammaproteobacteria bacterium]